MKGLTKRETPIQNLAFVSLCTAIVALLSLLLEYVPFSAFLVVLILPTVSAFSVEYTKKKYGFLFLVASLLLSFIVTLSNYMDTLFYVYPALLSGFLYGTLRKYRLPIPLIVFACSVLSLLLHYAIIPLIDLIYEIDIIAFTITLFGLSQKTNVLDIVPAFLFIYSLAEIGISHLFIELTNKKFHYEAKDEERYANWYLLISVIFGTFVFLFMFIAPSIAYLFLIVSFYFLCAHAMNLFPVLKTWHYLVLGALLLVSIFLIAILYPFVPSTNGLLLIEIPLLSFDFAFFLFGLQYLNRRKDSHGK